MSCDNVLFRRFSRDMCADEVLGLLSRAEVGRGRLRLGVCIFVKLDLTCCSLSSFSCCLLKEAPLPILNNNSNHSCNEL